MIEIVVGTTMALAISLGFYFGATTHEEESSDLWYMHAQPGQRRIFDFPLNDRTIELEVNNGMNLLQFAAYHGELESFLLLLERGANPLYEDKNGLTAADYAFYMMNKNESKPYNHILSALPSMHFTEEKYQKLEDFFAMEHEGVLTIIHD